MHFESHAIATGEPKRPYLARVTCGTRNEQKVIEEWPASSLKAAQGQADDWLAEYVARIGLGDDRVRDLAIMRARWVRMEAAAYLPDLPEPQAAYINSIEGAVEDAEQPVQTSVATVRRAYLTKAKVRGVVEAARASGIDVAGIRVWPDGSIAAFDRRLTGNAVSLREGLSIDLD